MSATNEERRSIASELRKAERYMYSCDFAKHVARAVDPEDETETWDGWCRSRLEGAGRDEEHMLCAIMGAIEDYRHPERMTAKTVRACDRDALLALEERGK